MYILVVYKESLPEDYNYYYQRSEFFVLEYKYLAELKDKIIELVSRPTTVQKYEFSIFNGTRMLREDEKGVIRDAKLEVEKIQEEIRKEKLKELEIQQQQREKEERERDEKLFEQLKRKLGK